MGKPTIFLLLTILVSISWAQLPGYAATLTTLSQELNGDVTVSENVNEIIAEENITGSGNGEYLITDNWITDEETTSGNENAPADVNEEEQTNEPNNAIDEEQTADPNNAIDKEQTAEPNNVIDEEQTTEPNNAIDEEQTTEPNNAIDEEQNPEPNNAIDEEQTTEANNAIDEEQTTESNNAIDDEQNTEPNNGIDEEQTTEPNNAIAEEQTTEANNAIDEEQTTESNKAVDEEQTTEPNKELDTTTNAPVESTTTTASPPPICATPGVQANEQDCRQYLECTPVGSEDGNLHLIAKSCPEKNAFSPELNRCSRDISACTLDIQCLNTGAILDPADNSSYYYCQKHYVGNGYFIFHVECESYQIYHPNLGKCVVDLSNFPPVFPPIGWGVVKDVDIVKEELKTINKQYKAQMKAQEKLEKEKAKIAKKQAKLEEKLKKENIKQEAAFFVCVAEGKFPSQFADNVYIQCITKKTKLKAISMQCIPGTTFNPEIGSCIVSVMADNNSNNSVSSDEDD